MKIINAVMLYTFLLLSSVVFAQTSPVPMLEGSANQIIATLKANKSSLKSKPDIIYKAVDDYLLPHVDVLGMARSVLGREAWQKASAAQKAQFSKAFTQLVIHTYAGPLAQYSNETIQFLPVRGSLNSRFIRINSVIVRPEGQNIQLSYSLVAKEDQWKIYDLSVEGVSLLQSFRSQFAQVLQHSDLNEVIRQMQKKQ